MISPEYFECASYAEMKEVLEKGQCLWCEAFDITLKPLGGGNLTIYTSFKKAFGFVTEVTFENMFSLTEDSIQTAIMEALGFQEEKGHFNSFHVVCYDQSPPLLCHMGNLQNSVSRLVQVREYRPTDEIYLEPILKDRGLVGSFLKRIFS